MKNELANLDRALEEIDEIVKDTALDKMLGQTRDALQLSRAIRKMREVMAPMMDEFLQLKGTPLGFITDQDYPKPVILDCLIEALLRGAHLVGNEVNIISGRCYLTKNYYRRQLSEMEGLSELRVREGVPNLTPEKDGALVPMWATWAFNGVADSISCEKTADSDTRIAVRVNKAMGTDAIIGKAHRKLYARIFNRLTGSSWAEAEAETAEPVETFENAAEPPKRHREVPFEAEEKGKEQGSLV